MAGESAPFEITQTRPAVSGHLPDHTMRYDATGLPDTAHWEIWSRRPRRSLANGPVGPATNLAVCTSDTDCPEYDDGRVITLDIDTMGCGDAVACVVGIPPLTAPPDMFESSLRNLMTALAAGDVPDTSCVDQPEPDIHDG